MPTTDGKNLSDNDNESDKEDETKSWCSICGSEISPAEALQCDECGCTFCSADCARKYPHCEADFHR
jgi:hypothetical protein